MASLLCPKSNSGSISLTDQKLCDLLLNDNQKTIPYLIKEKKNESTIGDYNSYVQSESNVGYAKSNLTSTKKGADYLKNSVMFNIPSTTNKTFQTSESSRTKKSYQEKAHSSNNLTAKSNNTTRRDTNVSSTALSSIPGTHSSLSSASMDKFNSNENYQHEKKKISRKKLKHVQNQLENRLSVKSATTSDLYKELNKIVADEQSFAQKIKLRLDKCERDKTRKREVIYKNWYRNVYEPMQSEIYNMMLSNTAEYARNLRNFNYLEYLNQTNKRRSVFQDDFEPSEYNPLNKVNLDASISQKLVDPTILPYRKENKESNISKDVKLPTISKFDSPRSDVVWNNWILDQYNTIDSTVRAKSSKKCNSSRHTSEYNLEWDRGYPEDSKYKPNLKSKSILEATPEFQNLEKAINECINSSQSRCQKAPISSS